MSTDKRSGAAADRGKADGRSGFDRFVEGAYLQVSRAPFFGVCVLIVVVWAVSFPLFPDAKSWQVVIHTVGSVVSLMLLVLLENAGRRSEEAAQEKLNVIAEALSDLMESRAQQDPQLQESVRRLRDAVGLEARH